MISKTKRLEEQVDNLLKEMDFSELLREPFNLRQSLDGVREELKAKYGYSGIPFDEYIRKTDREIMRYFEDNAIKERDRLKEAQKHLSGLLRKELNFSEEDIKIIQTPIGTISLLRDAADFIKRHNPEMDFSMSYRNIKISPELFERNYKDSGLLWFSCRHMECLESITSTMKKKLAILRNNRMGEDIAGYLKDNQVSFLERRKIEGGFWRLAKINAKINALIFRDKKDLIQSISRLREGYNKILKDYSSLEDYFMKKAVTLSRY